jgi:hypothetical protein
MNGSFIPENLTVAGPMVEVNEIVTLAEGQKVVRGEVLSTDGTTYSSWSDGDDAVRIAEEDADATGGVIEVSVFKGGNFNFNGLTLPDGTTAKKIRDSLWVNNIHIATNISGGA